MRNLPRYLRNLAFYCIVVVGAVLSIVSIVVLPDLRSTVTVLPEVSADSLYVSMTAAATESATRHATPPPFQPDSAVEAKMAMDTSAGGRAILSLYRAQQSLVGQWETRKVSLAAESRRAAQVAALTYRAEATRPGDRDRLLRFLELRMWHHERTQKADAYLDSVRARLGDVNGALIALRETPGAAVDPAQVNDVRTRIRLAQRQLSLGHTYGPIPSWRAVRLKEDQHPWWSGWNPISAMSWWLRTYRALELVSVMGMLGLGLLGAAVSSFVRRRQAGEGADTPIETNLTGLILTGTTAAFATYLAVKGSLAVVSTDGAQANPYVLLLTCFVAAVYWEAAWERVRKLVGEEPSKPEEKPIVGKPAPAAVPPQQGKQVQVPGTIVSDHVVGSEHGSTTSAP